MCGIGLGRILFIQSIESNFYLLIVKFDPWESTLADRNLLLLAHDRYLYNSEIHKILLFAGLDWLVKLHGETSDNEVKLVFLLPNEEIKSATYDLLQDSIRMIPDHTSFKTKIAVLTISEFLCGKFLNVEKVVFQQMEQIVHIEEFWLAWKTINNRQSDSFLAPKGTELMDLSCIYHAETFTKLISQLKSLDSSMLCASNNPIDLTKFSELSVSIFPVATVAEKANLILKLTQNRVANRSLGIIKDQSLINPTNQLYDILIEPNGKRAKYDSIIVPRLLTCPKDLFQILRLFSFEPKSSDSERQLIFIFEPNSETNTRIEKMFKFIEHISRIYPSNKRLGLLSKLTKIQGIPHYQICPIVQSTGTCSAGLFCSYRHIPHPHVMTRGENYAVCMKQQDHPISGQFKFEISNIIDANTIKATFFDSDLRARFEDIKDRLGQKFNSCLNKNPINQHHLKCGQLVALEIDREWYRAWVRPDESKQRKDEYGNVLRPVYLYIPF